MFKPGDVVQLKSGGPLMTVVRVEPGTDGTPMVECTWFDKSEQKNSVFRELVLDRAQ